MDWSLRYWSNQYPSWGFELRQESLELVRKLDSELVAMKYNTIEIEERRARNEALIAAANNEVMAMVWTCLWVWISVKLSVVNSPNKLNLLAQIKPFPQYNPLIQTKAFTPVQTASPEQMSSPSTTCKSWTSY